MHLSLIIPFFWLALGLFSCGKKSNRQLLGSRIAAPIDVVTAGDYFYLLNSNGTDHDYLGGSILILDDNGDIKDYVNTPRLGATIAAAATAPGAAPAVSILLAAFRANANARENEQTNASLNIYKLEGSAAIFQQSFDLEGETPLKITTKQGFDKAFISCASGKIYILENIYKNTVSMRPFRNYPGAPRPTVYIAADNSYAIFFAKSYGSASLQHTALKEIASTGIPDQSQKSANYIAKSKKSSDPRQMMVVSLADTTYKEYKDIYTQEARWVSFPDSDQPAEAGSTTFWTDFRDVLAVDQTIAPNTFYVTIGGIPSTGSSKASGQVYKVTIKPTAKPLEKTTEGTFLQSKDFLTFEKITSDPTELRYPNTLKFSSVDETRLIYSNFLSPVDFSDPYSNLISFDLTAKKQVGVFQSPDQHTMIHTFDILVVKKKVLALNHYSRAQLFDLKDDGTLVFNKKI